MKRWGLVAAAACGLVSFPAMATWSIVAVDTRTKEVGVASATCLTNFDLRAITPVVLVGVGAAAVQSQGDFDGRRRPIILREFRNSTPSVDILDIVAAVPGHQGRQYGIGDTSGSVVTFSGSSNGAHASGVVGQIGTIHYAIQGNVLTGRPVVLEAERMFREAEGDLAARLMAAMEGARVMGGDGRCSCNPNNPPGCGSPPPNFQKSAHIGYMILARPGDIDGDVCNAGGCARGDYFMNFNVPFQNSQAPDPVFQLRDLYDAWRLDLIGRPDAIETNVRIEPIEGGHRMRIELRDWQSTPLGREVDEVTVEHAEGSAGGTAIGNVVNEGSGVYSVELRPNGRAGIDRFAVTADDGERPVVLLPLPEIRDRACDVLVKKTVAAAKSRKLLVKAQLKDEGGAPVVDHEVNIKLATRIDGPLFHSLGRSNERGIAKRKFVVFPDTHTAHVISVIPPDPGGQCLDPDRPGQDLSSEPVVFP